MSSDNQDPQDLIGSELVREDSSFADIVVQFVEGLQERLDTMEAAINAADFESLRVVAHQIKGSGWGYGYPILSQQAAELEKRAKERVLDDCVAIFDDLKKLCDRVVINPDQSKA